MDGGGRAKLFDRLYGTKQYTAGAELQLPRKVPMRVEPKAYFANERTYLNWVGMGVTLGGVSTALLGFSTEDAPGTAVISRRTVDVITVIYAPLSIVIICYGLFTYEQRRRLLRTKQVGFFDDRVGPTTAAVLVLLTLVAVFCVALVDYWH